MTGATVVFHMRLHPAGAVKISSGAMTAVGSATLGRFKYVWQTGDTDTPGTYEGEVQATFSNGAIRTFPPNGYFLIFIADDIAEWPRRVERFTHRDFLRVSETSSR